MHEAQTHLARLLRRVATGEAITISQAGRPVAQLVPFMSAPRRPRPLDTARGLLTVPLISMHPCRPPCWPPSRVMARDPAAHTPDVR